MQYIDIFNMNMQYHVFSYILHITVHVQVYSIILSAGRNFSLISFRIILVPQATSYAIGLQSEQME